MNNERYINLFKNQKIINFSGYKKRNGIFVILSEKPILQER